MNQLHSANATKTGRVPVLASSCRDLPIPIDNYSILSTELLSRIRSYTPPSMLPSWITFWVTVGPGISGTALQELLSQPGILGVRVSMSKFQSPQQLFEYVTTLATTLKTLASDASPVLCVDISGKKIRITDLEALSGQNTLDLLKGEIVALVPQEHLSSALADDYFAGIKLVPIDRIIKPERHHQTIYISDGWVQLRFEQMHNGNAICAALHDARLYNRRGVDFVGLYDPPNELDEETLSSLTPWLVPIDSLVTSYALSFANSPNDVSNFQSYLARFNMRPRSLVAKIETITGISNARQIVKTASALMIARGDLAVQIAERKRSIIDVEDEIRGICRDSSKLCIVATRVADSLETGSTVLDDYEISRLYHEIMQTGPLVLMLANETSWSADAVRHFQIVHESVRKVYGVLRESDATIGG